MSHHLDIRCLLLPAARASATLALFACPSPRAPELLLIFFPPAMEWRYTPRHARRRCWRHRPSHRRDTTFIRDARSPRHCRLTPSIAIFFHINTPYSAHAISHAATPSLTYIRHSDAYFRSYFAHFHADIIIHRHYAVASAPFRATSSPPDTCPRRGATCRAPGLVLPCCHAFMRATCAAARQMLLELPHARCHDGYMPRLDA